MFRSVFIADTGKEVFVWIGKRASEGENKNGLTYAHVSCRGACRAANYCRTSDNVRLNLANVRAKVILIRHWSDHKRNCHILHFFAVTKSDCKFTQFAFCNKIYEAF